MARKWTTPEHKTGQGRIAIRLDGVIEDGKARAKRRWQTAKGALQALAGKRWDALNANQRWSVVEAVLTALGYLDDGVVTVPDEEA